MRTYLTCQCANCGRAFLAPPNQIRRGRGLNCSKACADARHGAWPDRFWRKVDKTDTCWLWTAALDRKGYGVIHPPNRVLQRAHRVAWELLRGPIPDDLDVCHDCPGGDNPRCVNPAHLWLGTNDENMADMARKGRTRTRLTPEITRDIRTRYASGGISQQRLADQYGLHQTTISRVIHGRSQAHVT